LALGEVVRLQWSRERGVGVLQVVVWVIGAAFEMVRVLVGDGVVAGDGGESVRPPVRCRGMEHGRV
jgi:hypothetical protein